MKIIRTVILAACLLGMAGGGLKAQLADGPDILTGQKGKMTVFRQMPGVTECRLSWNEKYLYGAIQAKESGYIYEIATGAMKLIDDAAVIGVIDTNNYATSKYLIKEGKKIEYDVKDLNMNTLEDGNAGLASADLNTITYNVYIGSNYSSVILDGNGKKVDTIPQYEQGLPMGYGTKAECMTPDGKLLGLRTSIERAYMNISPAIYNRETGSIFVTIDEEDPANPKWGKNGMMRNIREDGNIALCDIDDYSYWVEFDRESEDYTLHYIPVERGYEKSIPRDIKGDWVIGFDQPTTPDVYGRILYLYNIKTQEKVLLRDHLRYRYGLIESARYPLFTIYNMSKDLRTFSGYTYDDGMWMPYMIQLDEHQVHPMVRNMVAHQPFGQKYVQLQWEAPLSSEYTLKGYEIYRDSALIATIDNTATLRYEDNDAKIDTIHGYMVKALYTDEQTSDYTEEQRLFVVGDNSCLPVVSIESTISYNRTVNLSWGLPSASIKTNAFTAPAAKRAAEDRVSLAENSGEAVSARESKYMVNDKLDFVEMRSLGTYYSSSSVRVGNYLYVGDWQRNIIFIIDVLSGVVVEGVTISDEIEGIYDMTYHGGFIYCVSNNTKVGKIKIDDNDPLKLSLSGVFSASYTPLTHIAYMEGAGEDGSDLLLTGNYNSLLFFDPEAISLDDQIKLDKTIDIKGLIISGSAYHNGRLYFANQHDGNSSLIETYDWESGKHLFTTDLLEIPAVDRMSYFSAQGYSCLASGLSLGELEDGTVILEATIQPIVDYNHTITLEVESSPKVKGYIVYRNGEKYSDTLKARHYTDVVYEPGTYTYTIEYLSENGCSSNSKGFAEEKVTIYPTGECNPPTQVKVVESNQIGFLTWELPEGAGPSSGFVGFNVYRNDELVLDKALDLKYYDETIEKGKESVYVVEAFYDNSCVASDTVSLVPSFEGFAAAPSAVRVKDHKNGDSWASTTTWELPYFEDPMALGYCGMLPGGAVTPDGTNTAYAIIGWTREDGDLDPYEDLYVVGVEFMIAMDVTSIEGIVYVDDKLVHSEKADRVKRLEWNQVFFGKHFSMNQKEEVAVGYKATYKGQSSNSEALFVFDVGPGTIKGGLWSVDGRSYYSLIGGGINANLLINALVVRKRDLEDAAKSADPKAYIQKKAFVAGTAPIGEVKPIASAPKSTSESYTLQGFNVYRDEVKLNEELLKTFSFEDQGLEFGGEYMYQVSAVYAGDKEVMSEEVWLSNVANGAAEAVCPIAVQPNPVQDVLHIDGEYTTLSLIDMTGRVVLSDVRNAKNISMTNFKTGLYFVRIVLTNGEEYITKIVKQ